MLPRPEDRRHSLRIFFETPAPRRDKFWVCAALQAALQVEFATIPPYLVAMWSVRDEHHPVRKTIEEVVLQEMLHMGIACNLLTALGTTPQIDNPHVVPRYPGHLPWRIHPHLLISLERLSLPLVEHTFMELEKPEFATHVWHRGHSYPTIGAFYSAIYDAMALLDPREFSGDRQLTTYRKIIVPIISSREEALNAVNLVKEQGEGTESSPLWGPSVADKAHYFRFGEIFHEREYKQTGAIWAYDGNPIPFPCEIRRMAPIPFGGYPTVSQRFDELFTDMVGKLQAAWECGSQTTLNDAVAIMRDDMKIEAQTLMDTSIFGGEPETYGPSFILRH